MDIENIDIFSEDSDRNVAEYGERNRWVSRKVKRRVSIGETLEIIHDLEDENATDDGRECIRLKFDEYKLSGIKTLKKIKEKERTLCFRSRKYFTRLEKLREKLFPERENVGEIILLEKPRKTAKKQDTFDSSILDDELILASSRDKSSFREKAGKVMEITNLRKEIEELKSSFHFDKSRALGNLKTVSKNIKYSIIRLEGLADECQHKMDELNRREERNLYMSGILKDKDERMKNMLAELTKKEQKLDEVKRRIEQKIEEDEKKNTEKSHDRDGHDSKVYRRKRNIFQLRDEIKFGEADLKKLRGERNTQEIVTQKLKDELCELQKRLEEEKKNLEEEYAKAEEEFEGERDVHAPLLEVPDMKKEVPLISFQSPTPKTARKEEVEEEEEDDLLNKMMGEDIARKIEKEEPESIFDDISTEVQSFKSDFQDLFTQIDAVRKRMDFYKADATSRQNTSRIAGPSGKVTIVFTAVEGSTKIWDTDLQLMLTCMKIHNTIVRNCLSECNGYEVKTEGDTFIISFQHTEEAIKFTLQCQLRLNATNWPKALGRISGCESIRDPQTDQIIFSGVRVAMGMHVGSPIVETDKVTKRTDYYGPMVNKSARIEGMSSGGAIAISNDVFREVRHFVGTGTINNQEEKRFGTRVSVKIIGRKKLKGVTELETVRYLYPEKLRKRHEIIAVKLSEDKDKEKENKNMKLSEIIDSLSKRQEELDLKRGNITNKIGFELRLKSLETSNMEKEEVIAYLRDKVKDLKTSYLQAVEKKQDSLKGENIIKTDVEKVLDKYKNMQRMYSELKGNFKNVEQVFNVRLKDELKKFQGDLSSMRHKIFVQQHREVYTKRIWDVTKKGLRLKLKHCKKLEKKQDMKIRNLEEQVLNLNSEISMRKELMIKAKKKRMAYEKRKKHFQEKERKVVRNNIRKKQHLIQEKKREKREEKEVTIPKLFEIGSFQTQKVEKRWNSPTLSVIRWDDCVVKNTEIFLPLELKKEQEDMIQKDMKYLQCCEAKVDQLEVIGSPICLVEKRKITRKLKRMSKKYQKLDRTRKYVGDNSKLIAIKRLLMRFSRRLERMKSTQLKTSVGRVRKRIRNATSTPRSNSSFQYGRTMKGMFFAETPSSLNSSLHSISNSPISRQFFSPPMKSRIRSRLDKQKRKLNVFATTRKTRKFRKIRPSTYHPREKGVFKNCNSSEEVVMIETLENLGGIGNVIQNEGERRVMFPKISEKPKPFSQHKNVQNGFERKNARKKLRGLDGLFGNYLAEYEKRKEKEVILGRLDMINSRYGNKKTRVKISARRRKKRKRSTEMDRMTNVVFDVDDRNDFEYVVKKFKKWSKLTTSSEEKAFDGSLNQNNDSIKMIFKEFL